MRVRVDLLPAADYEGETVLLIDILKSCTAAPILFDNGLRRLTLARSLRDARQFAAEEGRLLVGDRGGVPPEGFNHASSPALLRHGDFSGREAVMLSDNAPKALTALAGASRVLLASLYNANAAARALLAGGTERVCLVCCGHGGQEDLDDSLAAGFLAGEIARLAGGVQLEGAARLSVGLLRAFPDPLEALWHSAAGRELRRLEMAEDLAVATAISQSRHVPHLEAVSEGRHGKLFHFGPLPLSD